MSDIAPFDPEKLIRVLGKHGVRYVLIALLGGPVAVVNICAVLVGVEYLHIHSGTWVLAIAVLGHSAVTMVFYFLLRKKNDKRRRSAA